MSESFHPEMARTELTDTELRAALPRFLAELCAIIPLTAVLKIGDAFGGTRLWVPLTANPEGELFQIIGAEAARALSKVWGGDCIEVPKTDSFARLIRNKRIRAARDGGAKIRALAREHKLSQRSVTLILNSGKSEARRS